MRPAQFRATAVLSVLLCVVPILTALPAAAAGSVSLSQTSTSVAADFASQRYADAWDYSNVEDLSLVPLLNGSGNTNTRYDNGVLSSDVTAGGWLNLVNATPGSIAYGRDGRAIPIDAGQYTRFAIKLWSSRDNVAQVWWRTCAEANTACYGAIQFPTVAGWGTYDLNLTRISQTAADWRGSIVAMQINPTAAFSGSIKIDWTRVYQPSDAGKVTVTRSGGSGTGEIILDQDTDAGNGNETVLRRDGNALRVPANGTVVVDSSLLPAGDWRLAVRDTSGVQYAGSPLHIAGAPMPVVLDPDIAGGSDVHETMGGSAWDFNESGDVRATANVAGGTFSGGTFYGRNGAPNNWDPQIDLTMPGAIDGSRYHRVTLKIGYDGGWRLDGNPGGGMMTRLIWQTAGNPAAYQDSDDVVVVPGDQTITVDLATNPSTAVVDGDNRNPIGWAGQQISSLRFDPNEDPSSTRTWRVDDIRLAADDQGAGSFSVRYQDNNWAPGTVADIYVDRGAPGQNRSVVAAGVPVTQGVNSFAWALGNLQPGTYWVLVGMRRGDTSASAFSTGPVQMRSGTVAPAPVAPAGPVGNFDSITQVGPDGLQMRGWAYDATYGGASSPVHLYVDATGSAVTADAPRADVGAALGISATHGFDATMRGIGPGAHSVCAYAFRSTGSTQLGCRTFTMASDPTGNVESWSPVTGGVRMSGWALDRSTTQSVDVHAYVDGTFAGAATADGSRPDVDAVYAGYGAAHGVSMNVPAGPGDHMVCLYALDKVAPGGNALIGCRRVSVPAAPFGYLEQVKRSGTTVSFSGWAIDPTTSGTTGIHVYVDGVGRAVTATSGQRGDVNAAFPQYRTAAAGFSGGVGVSDAAHQVCVYAVGTSASVLLGCRSV